MKNILMGLAMLARALAEDWNGGSWGVEKYNNLIHCHCFPVLNIGHYST